MNLSGFIKIGVRVYEGNWGMTVTSIQPRYCYFVQLLFFHEQQNILAIPKWNVFVIPDACAHEV